MRQKSVRKATARTQSAKRKMKKAGIRGQGAAGKDQSVESRIEQNLSQLSSLNSELTSLLSSRAADSDAMPAAMPPPNPILAALINAISDVGNVIDSIRTELDIDSNLTGRERARLIGVKSRNYGFIAKSLGIVRDNPNFTPPNFDLGDTTKNLVHLEHARQLTMLIEQLRHLSDDFLLTSCDTAYRDALRIYGSLREQSRNRVPGANALFQELLQFFTLRRRPRNGENGSTEPTINELERDFKRLIHGKADGDIFAKHESPTTSGGVHEVIDNVHSAKCRVQRSERKVKEDE